MIDLYRSNWYSYEFFQCGEHVHCFFRKKMTGDSGNYIQCTIIWIAVFLSLSDSASVAFDSKV
jgi:hypothetical protein